MAQELKWNWVYYPYLDAPNKQKESALKAGYIKVVIKSEADKVIAEKDAEIARLKDKLQAAEKQTENLINSASSLMLGQDKTNDKLDAEITELKAENIRLRKRLFRMCARLGKMGYLAFHNIQTKLTTFGDDEGVAMALLKKNQWRNVERKCRAKAEEYK